MQLALFADTIIASFLAAGALSALYYADRLYQLPIGVIGIAVGTVLLPEMAQPASRPATKTARAHAQNRAIEFTLLLAIPCVVAFLVVPDLIMRALFMRGKFTAADAQAAATDARRLYDRAHPVRADAQRRPRPSSRAATPRRRSRPRSTAAAVNIALKIACSCDHAGAGRPCARDLDRRLDQFRADALVRPARAASSRFDAAFKRAVGKLALAGVALAAALWLAQWPVLGMFAGLPAARRDWRCCCSLPRRARLRRRHLGLFGKAWLAALWRTPKATTPPSPSAPPAPE